MSTSLIRKEREMRHICPSCNINFSCGNCRSPNHASPCPVDLKCPACLHDREQCSGITCERCGSLSFKPTCYARSVNVPHAHYTRRCAPCMNPPVMLDPYPPRFTPIERWIPNPDDPAFVILKTCQCNKCVRKRRI